MTLSCDTLRSQDPIASALCQELSSSLDAPPLRFDRGEHRIDYRQSGAAPLQGRPNGQLEPIEIYQQFLDLTLPPRHARHSAQMFFRKFQCSKPWEFDQHHLPMVRRAMQTAKREAARLIAAHPEQNPIMLRANTLLQVVKKPRREGGLGIRFRNHMGFEADANVTIDRGFARCSEFQSLYYGMARLMGLAVAPLEIPQTDARGNYVPHGAIMITDEARHERFFADLQIPHVQKEPPYAEYYVGTSADLFATFLNNRSLTPGQREMRVSQSASIPLRQLEAIAPHNALGLYGLAQHYLARNEDYQALTFFRRAATVRPNFAQAWSYQCGLTWDTQICQRAGDIAESSSLEVER